MVVIYICVVQPSVDSGKSWIVPHERDHRSLLVSLLSPLHPANSLLHGGLHPSKSFHPWSDPWSAPERSSRMARVERTVLLLARFHVGRHVVDVAPSH